RRRLAEQPGRRLDRRLPRDLVGLVAARLVPGFRLLLEQLHLVEVHVREAVPLLLVELDARAAPLGHDRLPRDRLLEGRVLGAVVRPQHEARVAGLRLERLHLGNVHDRLGHHRRVPVSRPMTRALDDGYELDDDPARVDVDAVHDYLATESYWAKGRPRETVERLVREAARVVGLYKDGRQVGFCRAATDGVAFVYLADV